MIKKRWYHQTDSLYETHWVKFCIFDLRSIFIVIYNHQLFSFYFNTCDKAICPLTFKNIQNCIYIGLVIKHIHKIVYIKYVTKHYLQNHKSLKSTTLHKPLFIELEVILTNWFWAMNFMRSHVSWTRDFYIVDNY